MRLIVVALLGIEITILALASAASAATHPEGQPASSGQYETGLPGWEDGPALYGQAALAEAISDAYAVGPPVSGSWAFERLMMARERLEAMREWPLIHSRWDVAAQEQAEDALDRWASSDRPHAVHERPYVAAPSKATVQKRVRKESATRPEASKAQRSPVRTGVAVMPQVTARVAHKRAQVDLTRVMPRQAAVQMSHATASGWLKSAGLRTKSTGNCTSKHMHHCTSLDSVRTGTIARMIELKRDSRCPIMVTGGTEEGHAPGHFSHGNGYKLDITHNSCIDHYITKHHDKAGVRGDGAALYRSGSGTTFADESDHWDILFR
ncbi:hypothetical protein GCM10022419_023320 [Nonomuraea rosea]|uniref:Peptidase M15B domain-containing protein n=1 Tax=Nonomuraea rosea TaxID=638574 RepID=A0ABP6VXT5_9ACTN